jgi:4-hydroxybenzoate polyprenyltransferase
MTLQMRQFFPAYPLNYNLLPFIISATLVSYNFHWYLTRPEPGTSRRGDWTIRNRRSLLVLMLTGIAGCIYFFIPLRNHWMPIAASVIITFIYSAPKIPVFNTLNRIARAKTFFLTVVWVYVTSIMYLLVKDLPLNAPAILFCLSRFFLIYCICILFDYRDREDDKKQGLTSLPVLVKGRSLTVVFFLSATAFAGCTLALLHYQFSAVIVALLLLPGIITAALYNYAKHHFSDYLYYFVLDGLMMLSPLCTLLLSFKYF